MIEDIASKVAIIPYLTVIDAAKTMEFYSKAFGFELLNQVTDESDKIVHVEMQFGNVLIMFAPEGAHGNPAKAPKTLNAPSPVNLYLYCDDVDALYKEAIEHGASVNMKPQDSYWGDRFCNMTDIDGHSWSFAKRLQ